MRYRIEFKVKIPYIDIHTHHPRKSEEVITVQSLFLQDIDPHSKINAPFTTAIHPWHSDNFELGQIRKMVENLITNQMLIAIGETGLDKLCKADYGHQKKVFNLQVDYAESCHKPLIIHAVKSWNELLTVFRKIKVPVILHGYSQGVPLTRQLIDLGCYFSIGKSIMNPSPGFLDAIQIIPLSNMFLETDESLMPVEGIYHKMAETINLPPELLKIQIYTNFTNLFN